MSTKELTFQTEKAQENMKNLNNMNRQCLIVHYPIKKKADEKALPDYEGIEIVIELINMKNRPKKTKKILYLHNIGAKINLYNCTFLAPALKSDPK